MIDLRYSSSLMSNLEIKLSRVEALMMSLESKMDDPNSDKVGTACCITFRVLYNHLRVLVSNKYVL